MSSLGDFYRERAPMGEACTGWGEGGMYHDEATHAWIRGGGGLERGVEAVQGTPGSPSRPDVVQSKACRVTGVGCKGPDHISRDRASMRCGWTFWVRSVGRTALQRARLWRPESRVWRSVGGVWYIVI